VPRVAGGQGGEGEVLQGQSDRVEQGDLLRVGAAGGAAGQDVAQFALEVALGGGAVAQREHHHAGFPQLDVGAVDDDGRPGHAGRVDLAVVGTRWCADGVDVQAWVEPFTADHGFACRGQGAEDVGGLDDTAGVPCDDHLERSGAVGGVALAQGVAERADPFGRAGPHDDGVERADPANRCYVLDGERSGADQPEHPAVGAGEGVGGYGAGGRGAHPGAGAAGQDGEPGAGGGVEQEHGGLLHRSVRGAVVLGVGEDLDHGEAEPV
jgi:hypothetical protein